MEACPCGSQKKYSSCCEPLIHGKTLPSDAEKVLRSRYSAFVKGEIPYLRTSTHPSKRTEFDEVSVQEWSQQSEWKGLEILEVHEPVNGRAKIEFKARYAQKGQDHEHHELAEFRQEGETRRWYFYDAKTPSVGPIRRESPKVGRNDPCPCGSGKKLKKCCG